jgi:hypothetical protein
LRRGVLEIDADARTALGAEQLILGLGIKLDIHHRQLVSKIDLRVTWNYWRTHLINGAALLGALVPGQILIRRV